MTIDDKLFDLPEGINENDYWIVKPTGIEWAYVLTKIMSKHLAGWEKTTMPVIMIATDTDPIYLLRKEFLPVAVLSKYTGLTAAVLEGSKVIELFVKARPNLPKPTVGGWGEA